LEIRLANTEDEIRRCYPVMAQLRPHLSEAEFLERVKIQQTEQYELAFIEDQGVVEAAAGFRLNHTLYRGRNLYVDDLVTNEASRSKGYGDALLDWLIERAKAEKCETFCLDSGVQRFAAHRFYFRKRMSIVGYNFSLRLHDHD